MVVRAFLAGPPLPEDEEGGGRLDPAAADLEVPAGNLPTLPGLDALVEGVCRCLGAPAMPFLEECGVDGESGRFTPAVGLRAALSFDPGATFSP